MDRQYMVLAAMAFELVGLVSALAYVGRYFDQNHDWTRGLASGVGGFIGFAAWIVHLLVVMRALEKTQESRDRESK